MKFILMIGLLTFGLPCLAHIPQDGQIYATGGPVWYRTHQLNHDSEAPTTPGFGIIAEADLDQNGGVEIALFHLRKYYSIRRDNRQVDVKANRMYIAMGYRHWFKPWISAAGSFFSSYAMGDAKVLRDEFDPGTRPATSADDPTNYGLDFSLQFEPIHRDKASIVIDARYSYDLTSAKDENSNHFGVLVGFKWLIQGPDDDALPGR